MDSSQPDNALDRICHDVKNEDGFPRHPRLCNVKRFFRSLEIKEFGEEKVRHIFWDVGTIYNPSWGSVGRSPDRLRDKPMHAIPRLQAMLLFFTRRIRKFEVPENYKFHCDVELWEHFPEAMRHTTDLPFPPISSPPQGYLWNTNRSAASQDLATRKFDLSRFIKDNMESLHIMAFFQRYHLFFHSPYTVLSDELMWIIFPRTLTEEATVDGHDKNYYQPRVYSITLPEHLETVREQQHDELASDIPDKHFLGYNPDGRTGRDPLKIHDISPQMREGFIFPLGTTFLAKKVNWGSNISIPWAHNTEEIDKMLRYLEMRVRTTAMPSFYDAARDKLLWDKFPKAMSTFIGMPTTPPAAVYDNWPLRGYLTINRKSLFSTQAFDTHEALDYVGTTCCLYFSQQAAEFGAAGDYEQSLDLYLCKLFPKSFRDHTFGTIYGPNGEVRVKPTAPPGNNTSLFIYPAITADHRYGKPACKQEAIEDFTKIDTFSLTQPRDPLMPTGRKVARTRQGITAYILTTCYIFNR